MTEAIPRDWIRARHAAELIRGNHTRFLTVHLAALDHVQHGHGPFTPPALATLEELDAMIALLGDAMRTENPGLPSAWFRTTASRRWNTR